MDVSIYFQLTKQIDITKQDAPSSWSWLKFTDKENLVTDAIFSFKHLLCNSVVMLAYDEGFNHNTQLFLSSPRLLTQIPS